MKWNMGWMHDTLTYLRKDPVHRKYHHDQLTFGLLYAFTENFVLPLSHDEVVHGKGSLLGKMPGDAWQKFANLRLLYTYQCTYPGKKLLFMGGEFAQRREWDYQRELDWHLLEYAAAPGHAAAGARPEPPLPRRAGAARSWTSTRRGFEWIDCHDSQPVGAQLPAPRRRAAASWPWCSTSRRCRAHGYRIGVPRRAATASCSTPTPPSTAAAMSATSASCVPMW